MNWLTAVWGSVICHQLIPSIPEEPAMEEELLSSAVQRQCCTLGSPSTQHVALLPAGTSHLTWPLFSMGKQNTVCSFRVKKKKKCSPFAPWDDYRPPGYRGSHAHGALWCSLHGRGLVLGAEKVSHPAEDLALRNFLEESLKQKGLMPKMPSVLLSNPGEFAVVAEETLIYNR